MRTSFLLALAMLNLGLCEGLAGPRNNVQAVSVSPKDSPVRRHRPKLKEVPPEEKAKIPAAYLSIENFYARRDPDAVPPRIRVAGFYHNYTRQTVSGAAFSIDRWNGTAWTSLKSGPLGPIAANKPGAESLDLPPSNDAMKFRFVVTPSVEGSKQSQLSAGPVTRSASIDSNAKGQVVRGGSATDPVKPSPWEVATSPVIKAKAPVPYLSIDQVSAERVYQKIVVAGNLSNPNLRPVSGATYSFERWNVSGWSTIKSGQLESIQPAKRAYVSVESPMTFDAMRFRLRVSPSVEGTKEASLPQQVWVVQYRCPEWQILDGWADRTPLAASKRMKGLNGLGFDTKSSYVTNDYLVDRSTHLTVYYRSVKWQERTFPALAAAHAFQTSGNINATLPNREYADILPKTGVETKVMTRLVGR
jgi:hypothetical protein